MRERIYERELQCYKTAAAPEKNGRWASPNRYFDLTRLPTEGIRHEMIRFIFDRGRRLTLNSIHTEYWPYHKIAEFLSDCYPELDSFLDVPEHIMNAELKRWMIRHNLTVMQKRYRPEFGHESLKKSEVCLYLHRVYQFLRSEKDIEVEPVWQLDRHIRQNPVNPVKSLHFGSILQWEIREEVMEALKLHSTYKSAKTLNAELQAVKRFSEYLNQPEICVKSLQQLYRGTMEGYIEYLNTEGSGKRSYRTELLHLKSVLSTVGKIYQWDKLTNIILNADIPKTPQKSYRYYSDQELQRLNNAIVNLEPQIARALILQELLGNRISETLSLEQNCLLRRGGNWVVRIFQSKPYRTCYKPVSEEVIELLQKSIVYTQTRYGNSRYIFVCDSNPDQPMRYGYIQRHLMCMIRELDLRDDTGRLFGVGTHMFRHTYGKKLTEMHVDDKTIARLLGHSNTDSVRYYRKMGSEQLANETREVREAMSYVIYETVTRWDDA